VIVVDVAVCWRYAVRLVCSGPALSGGIIDWRELEVTCGWSVVSVAELFAAGWQR
jgi:hypothetical protein